MQMIGSDKNSDKRKDDDAIELGERSKMKAAEDKNDIREYSNA